MFEKALQEYMGRVKVVKRNNIIDAIINNEEYEEDFGYGEIGRSDISISHRVESISMDGDILTIDMTYSPISRIENIIYDFTILKTVSVI